MGLPPPPAVVLPLASPSTISLAIWAKKAEGERAAFSTEEMRNYRLAKEGNNPGALVLTVVTGAAEPKCFLTARTNSVTATPKIELIHSMGNYVVALGQADDLHGHTFAFVGDQVGNQLPSTFLEPARGGALGAFATAYVDVPSEAVVAAHYAQDHPPFFLPSTTAGVATDMIELCMIPLMWAPYFISGATPKETLDKIELLVASVAAADRHLYEFIQQWGRYACVAAGTLGADVNQSSVATSWRDFPRGVEYNDWAQGRFRAVYRMADTTQPPAPPAPVGDQNLKMAEAIVIGMKGASAAEKDKKEKFAAHEKSKILAACGLHEGEWDQVPPIYDKITEDGRTRSAVRDAMEQEYRATTMVAEFPSSVFLSTQLVSDMKDLKFGWQGSNAFESCHRGISPFAVPHSSIEVHQRLRALEEDAAQATTTTLADVRATRTRPPPCPTDYYGLLQMLCAYIKLLMMMFGSSCEHMRNVTTIYYLIKDKMSTFELLEKNNVAHLLWAIFTDARSYFNTAHDIMGNPPVSSLDWLIGALKGGTLPSTLGTPLQSLLSREGGPAKTPRGDGGQANNRRPEEPATPRYQRGPQEPNTNVHAKIEAATAAARRCNPRVDYRMVMQTAPQPKPRITVMQLNRAGCFDYLFFGNCSNSRCSFKHDGEVDEAKIDGAIDKMRPGLAKFVELN